MFISISIVGKTTLKDFTFSNDSKFLFSYYFTELFEFLKQSSVNWLIRTVWIRLGLVWSGSEEKNTDSNLLALGCCLLAFSICQWYAVGEFEIQSAFVLFYFLGTTAAWPFLLIDS